MDGMSAFLSSHAWSMLAAEINFGSNYLGKFNLERVYEITFTTRLSDRLAPIENEKQFTYTPNIIL